MVYFTFLLFLSLLSQSVFAATVTYDWAVTWVRVNPDGRQSRPAVGINGHWPCPPIKARVGDTVVVNLRNDLGNQTTSLHFHGLYQEGTNAMDGPPGATQCPVPPGASFRYEFKPFVSTSLRMPSSVLTLPHRSGQYLDGLRGPLIVEDPGSPYAGQYDEEMIVTLSDWYHDEFPGLSKDYLSTTANADGHEPVPYSGLLNEGQDTKYPVKAGKTYFVRVINMAGFSQMYLNFDEHDVTIIEADGVYTEPKKVESLYVATAQRYGVLLKAKSHPRRNYAITAELNTQMFDTTPPYVHKKVTGCLEYDSRQPAPPEHVVQNWNVIDDMTLVPQDGQALLDGNPDKQIVLDLNFFKQDGQNRAGFNNITYLGQKVPSLFTAMTTGAAAENSLVYGVNANAQVVKYGQLVEIVINNHDEGSHPIHLHGHAPQIVARGNGTMPASKLPRRSLRHRTPTSTDRYGAPKAPMRRDTWI
ncbi:hypothetical protein LTR28_006213, partial [Elasticomyces elasticus]